MLDNTNGEDHHGDDASDPDGSPGDSGSELVYTSDLDGDDGQESEFRPLEPEELLIAVPYVRGYALKPKIWLCKSSAQAGDNLQDQQDQQQLTYCCRVLRRPNRADTVCGERIFGSRATFTRETAHSCVCAVPGPVQRRL